MSAIKYIYWGFKIRLYVGLFLSVIISFSVQRGLRLWLILEINFLCFTAILSQSTTFINPNRNLYYFLVQSLGRVCILLRLFSLRIVARSPFSLLFFLALILKLGGAPFQLWYLKLIQKLSWRLIWVLSIWQKLIPLILLSLRGAPLFLVFGCLRILLGRLGTWAQKKIKKILGLSSIFSLGWVLISFTINLRVWTFFILGYGLSLLILLAVFSKINFSQILTREISLDSFSLVIFIFGLLILRGIPPFIGFFLKLSILFFLLNVNFLVGSIVLALSLYLIFVYVRILFLLFTYTKPKNLIFLKQSKLVWRELIILNILVLGVVMNLSNCIYST